MATAVRYDFVLQLCRDASVPSVGASALLAIRAGRGRGVAKIGGVPFQIETPPE